MTVPDVIPADAIPNGAEEPHGIIYKIRSAVGTDILSYVSATAQPKDDGSEEGVIKWNNNYLRSGQSQSSYIQIEFKKGFVFPTFYSFKSEPYNAPITREWDLYGLNNPNGTPEPIATNTSVDSTFCYPYIGDVPHQRYYCYNNNWGTFAVHSAKKAYKYFRIIGKNPLDQRNYYFDLAGFEIFGIYSKDGRTVVKPKRTYCFKSYPIAIHVPFYLVARFCLTIFFIK